MFFAVLEFWDLLMIGILIIVLTGGTAMASRRSVGNAATEERLRRMEDKLNILLTHNGIDYMPRTKERWQRLADANDKEQAVKEYCDAHSASLEEAEQVIEQYLLDVQQSTGR